MERVLEKSFIEMCCKEVLERHVVETCCRKSVGRSVPGCTVHWNTVLPHIVAMKHCCCQCGWW